ncbi:unnamed protein product [Oppiella nova]|uniref:Uncharacterized protein n=1 Tax=Oppiella nova TaxID=334625 RepID=A0A7R9QT08_9ACAR|nr:unnamed protein product [Oppiella nova]CAG2173298.1 unnamed protein product [Oppiella nova]
MKFALIKFNKYFIIIATFILFALSPINGQQYTQYSCDYNRYQLCQSDIQTSIQVLRDSQSGAPYSGQVSNYRTVNTGEIQSRCNAVRNSLDCLLTYTPLCMSNSGSLYGSYGSGSYVSVNSNDYQRNYARDIIIRGRNILESYCERDGGGSWKHTACFQRPEVRECEARYGFHYNAPSATGSTCRNYQEFRDCVTRIVQQSCYPHDSQQTATYLIDKASELSWTCDVSRPTGDRYGDNQWGYQRGNYDSRYDSDYQCAEKSGFYVRNCEDILLQRQRDVRDSSRGLVQYRECLGRVVEDICRMPSTTAVDILMGPRKWDASVTCREYTTRQCSHSYSPKTSYISVVVSIFAAILLNSKRF